MIFHVFTRARKYKYFISVAVILGIFYFQFQSIESTILVNSYPDLKQDDSTDFMPLNPFAYRNELLLKDSEMVNDQKMFDSIKKDRLGSIAGEDTSHDDQGHVKLNKYDNNIGQSPLASQEDIAAHPLSYFTVITTGGGFSRTNGKTTNDVYQEIKGPRVEKFPPKNIISLPRCDSSFSPKIQASNFPETSGEKNIRLARKNFVKDVFQRSWAEYKTHAWGTDELKPMSKQGYDPFLGWSATMVDALDTLQIMGLNAEYQEALGVVSNIHFNGTYRDVIPMFETTIRYLGGLLSSYDLSGGTQTILLDKARDLGDFLLQAFDTPNRMPLTYYKWRDDHKKIKYRAGSASLSAEVGSFTVEFTRLAQLTGENKYYDAVARITDMFHAYLPNSRIPWLLPQSLDMSGCRHVSQIDRLNLPDLPARPPHQKLVAKMPTGSEMLVARIEPVKKPFLKIDTPAPNSHREAEEWEVKDEGLDIKVETHKSFSSRDSTGRDPKPARAPLTTPLDPSKQVLVDQEPSNYWNRETCTSDETSITEADKTFQFYTIGSTVDSAYEYYMKEYLLLSGGEPKYVEMYNGLINAVKENILFKPLVKNNENILFPADILLSENGVKHPSHGLSHLACYAGGMLALGGKILNRQEDVDLAAKLTEACVWAYKSTRTGVMPESFRVRPCPGNSLTEPCEFNFEQQIAKERADTSSQSKTGPIYVDPVADPLNPNLTRWNVQNAYDMPRDFLDISPTYILRPEALESVFYMYRITGDKSWQEKGWNMFESIVNAAKIVNGAQIEGYASVSDVTDNRGLKTNLMDNSESFWWGETLKYAYLLFEDPNTISLDDYVFNTEAHPFKLSH